MFFQFCSHFFEITEKHTQSSTLWYFWISSYTNKYYHMLCAWKFSCQLSRVSSSDDTIALELMSHQSQSFLTWNWHTVCENLAVLVSFQAKQIALSNSMKIVLNSVIQIKRFRSRNPYVPILHNQDVVAPYHHFHRNMYQFVK